MQVGQRALDAGDGFGGPPGGFRFLVCGIGQGGKGGLQDGAERGIVAALQRGAQGRQTCAVGGGGVESLVLTLRRCTA